MLLATMIGVECSSTPYINQSNTPPLNSKNMSKEMSSVERVFQVFATWGINATVVSIPAREPIQLVIPIKLPITQ